MFSWPDPGTRVTVRYRRPAGSVPPLTDAVGHLLAIDPMVRVRTKTGAVVEFAPSDAVALRVLTDTPIRTSQIRGLEHAAAAAWPGAEHTWLDGWLLRAVPLSGQSVGLAANSAVPLDPSAHFSTVPAIVDWYRRRGLTPRLAVPDRVLALPPGWTGERTERVVVRGLSDVAAGETHPSIMLAPWPDAAWLRIAGGEIPLDVLTAVIDGELVFGTHRGAVAARAAVTEAPDGARWVGISVVRSADGADELSAADLCEALLAWGADRGATRGYMRVPDTGAATLAGALRFRLHHRRRYVPVRPDVWDSV
ncbi:GCN5 family acetyltransferase [Mycobacterium sp. 852002-40037_SCH5390672]|uniref:N-acetylglutamate synthase, CG3035 family n=1 Tax=Mycobacterium sp. 852002-40037_SCH5390672 TaxID=1834089 RepID=UPI0008056612|nr:GCN5 family acetyltransferase [Mycobacterium sp. 852002-40037_SCH5390672]OBB92505.1 GCN5 family acetyltransferase [Mycobacterium sp. 852002-40037_SCH5390672]